jgi:hypothetical protein
LPLLLNLGVSNGEISSAKLKRLVEFWHSLSDFSFRGQILRNFPLLLKLWRIDYEKDHYGAVLTFVGRGVMIWDNRVDSD